MGRERVSLLGNPWQGEYYCLHDPLRYFVQTCEVVAAATTWGVLLDPVRLDLQMPEMADPHPCLRTLSRMSELGGRVVIGTRDREGINYLEYFARGYYVNEGWLVWHWECCCSSGR